MWLDPGLHVTYRPRNSWAALARQFWATGVWRGELVRRLGRRNPMRFFAPPGLVVTDGCCRCFRSAGCGVRHAPALVVYARDGGDERRLREYATPLDRLRYALVLATMHVAWGSGFLVGLVARRGGTRWTPPAHRVSRTSRRRRSAAPPARRRARRRGGTKRCRHAAYFCAVARNL